YYDPEVTSCTSQSPCQLPMFGETGSPSNDQVMALWATQVEQITGGAVKVNPVDITFVNVLINSEFSPAGENPMPTYALGRAPDSPDPTDYTLPLYNPNSTYTQGDAVIQSLLVPDFTNGCAHGITDYNYYANSSFPQACQGIAYKAMLYTL